MNNEENLSNDGRIKGEYKTRYEDKRCRIKRGRKIFCVYGENLL